MERVIEFLDSLGVGNGLELSEDKLIELKNEAQLLDLSESKNRNALIETSSNHSNRSF